MEAGKEIAIARRMPGSRADILRTKQEARSLIIGPYDMQIAAHALALDCTLVTDDVREFQRVPGLRVENWLGG